MLITTDMVAQRRYARSAAPLHRTGVAIGPTVLRGLRDLGYRDTAGALAALIDNAIDGGATRIDVALETDGSAPNAIAVIDDGYGMVPEMMRAACALGVTFPLGDGPHLARNGFGLPSAPFSIGSRFELLSCPLGAPLHGVTMDLAEIVSDEVPEAHRASLPLFVSAYLATHRPTWSSGTAVVVEELDRASPPSAVKLRAEIAHHLGFVFAGLLASIDIRVDGISVAPVGRFQPRPPAVADYFERATVLIAGAQLTVDTALVATPAPVDAGFIISRLGRRVAVVEASPFFVFQRADARLRVEIDFPPALDDLFAPALTMQQVHVADDIWRALRAAGIGKRLESLRRKSRLDRTRGQEMDAPAAINRLASHRRRNRCQK